MNPQEQQKQTQQNMQAGSGLTRYRSAPSSYFTALLNSQAGGGDGFGAEDFAELFNPRASSPETQRIFSRFMNSSTVDTVVVERNNYSSMQVLPSPKREPDHLQQQPLPPPAQPLQRQQSNDYSSSASHMMYQSHNSEENLQNKAWPGSITTSRVEQIKMEAAAGGNTGGGNSGLIRHSSSPAGFLASINVEAEFGGMKGNGTRNYGGGSNANNVEASFSSASRFNTQIGFSSSSSRTMDPIYEIGDRTMANNAPLDQNFDEPRGNEDNYIADYINSWDDSDNFLQGFADKESKPLPNSDGQSDEGMRNRPVSMLSHHLSLPKSTSAELSMEKFMQDSVPCKIRAKRGCATHPRSIAERVRRTKISERIRKLQELVPNMEKQTSTSDMLDLAVDYIKDLQKQVKTLSDNRDNCSCAAGQR